MAKTRIEVVLSDNDLQQACVEWARSRGLLPEAGGEAKAEIEIRKECRGYGPNEHEENVVEARVVLEVNGATR